MNWFRTILDMIIVCIAFNGVVAFVWILEPKGFSVMLPKGINTSPKDIPKKNIKPIRLLEFILYPTLMAYVVLSAYEQSITGFSNLFLNAFIINLGWNFGDFFFLDWWLRAVYKDRVSLPENRDNEMWKTSSWMRKFGIVDHWIKGPIVCAMLSTVLAGIGLLLI